MGREECLLGPGQVASSEPDVAELRQWPAELAAHPRPQFVTGGERLLLGEITGARHPQQFGAMHPAAAVDPAERGTMAPALHHLGPLLREVVHHQALGGADDLAVHHPRRQRIDLARHQEGADLVEHRESQLDVAVEDGDPRVGGPSDHDRREYTESFSEVDGEFGLLPRRRHVPAHEPLVRAHHRDHCMHRPLDFTIEEPFGLPEPPAYRRHESRVHHQVHGDHGGGPSGLEPVVPFELQGVERFPRVHAPFEVPRAVGGLRPQFESFGRRALVSFERLEGGLPFAECHVGACILDR